MSALAVGALVADLVLPRGSRVAVDPTSRLDLVAAPQPTVDEACAVTTHDLHAVRQRLAEDGLGLVGLGLEPVRDDASVAAVRVTVGLAADLVQAERQRRLAVDVGVVLAAACANSPLVGDAPTGFRSTGLARRSAGGGEDLVRVRRPAWLDLAAADALPEPFWRVPVAVAAAVLLDAGAMARAERATAYVAGSWAEAARHGLSHPVLSHAAREVFDAAVDALPRLGATREVLNVVGAFADRFVARDRTPADEILAAWSGGREPLLAAATLVATPVRRRRIAPTPAVPPV